MRIGDTVHGRVWEADQFASGTLVDWDKDDPIIRLGDDVFSYKKGETLILEHETCTVVDSVTPRKDLLNEADKLVHSDRNATYGEPTQNFQDTAALWNVQFAHKLSSPFTADDVAKAMIGLKLARMKASSKYDHWVDIAGYAACGWECETTKED